MPDLFGGDPITEDEGRKAEQMAEGHPCPHCGRSDDWLANGRYGNSIRLDCDDCDTGILMVKLPAST